MCSTPCFGLANSEYEWRTEGSIVSVGPTLVFVSLGFVSELCHRPTETPGQHEPFRRHSHAHHCCGKSLIGSALVGFRGRQHARRESISSVLLQPLGHLSALDSTVCERSEAVYRTRRRIPSLFRDAISIQRFTDAPNASIAEIVSDLSMSSDRLRRFHRVGSSARVARLASTAHREQWVDRRERERRRSQVIP